jgi:L-fuconolactonase
MAEDVEIIDGHCHLWKLEVAQRFWLTAEFGPIFRSFTPVDLLRDSRECRVKSCVLIESGKTMEEHETMLQMVASSRLIGAIAPYVDLGSATLEQELDLLQRNPKFRAVRTRFESHPDPDILTRPDIIEGLRIVARRGVMFEFLVRARHLKDILKIYESVPDLKGVIEHMAKPDMRTGTDHAEWQSSMRTLATHTTVACKLSLSPRIEDLADICRAPGTGWQAELVKPYVGSLLEWFGPDRLMWGSDWPVSLLTSNYAQTLDAMRSAIGPLDKSEKGKIFRKTAMEFYKLTDDEDPGCATPSRA